jgi:hypothetical protein
MVPPVPVLPPIPIGLALPPVPPAPTVPAEPAVPSGAVPPVPVVPAEPAVALTPAEQPTASANATTPAAAVRAENLFSDMEASPLRIAREKKSYGPAVHSTADISNLNPSIVTSWIESIFTPKPTRRAGAVPVGSAAPFS